MSIRPRTLSTLMLLGSIALGAGAALLSSTPANAGDAKCRNEASTFPEIKAACGSGGKDAVKKLMNQIEKTAKAAGVETECLDCHTDKKTYPLTDNAKADYKSKLSKFVPDALKAIKEKANK